MYPFFTYPLMNLRLTSTVVVAIGIYYNIVCTSPQFLIIIYRPKFSECEYNILIY